MTCYFIYEIVASSDRTQLILTRLLLVWKWKSHDLLLLLLKYSTVDSLLFPPHFWEVWSRIEKLGGRAVFILFGKSIAHQINL